MTGKRISRRSFLRLSGAGALAGLGVAATGCTVNTTAQQGESKGGGSKNQLNLYNWTDYIAPSNIKDFEKKTGARVVQDFYTSNEEMLAKLQAGGTGYDIIVPSDYMVQIMAKSKLLEELDHSRIPNFKNIGKDFRSLPFDPGNRHSIPWQWGTTGIFYNRRKVGKKIESWDAMWDPRFKGKIAMLDDARELIAAALEHLGYSINTKDKSKLEEAKQLLIKQKPLLKGYFADTDSDQMVAKGDLLLAQNYSGNAMLYIFKNKDLDYVIPEPSSDRWTDNMCIPKGAPHLDLAYEFINFMLSPEQGAALTNYTMYGTPNQAAIPLVKKKIRQVPWWNPPESVMKRLQVMQDVGEATRLYERIFTEVKSA
ncbi:ABC transporter substrate-binding protein [Rubrobacter naiadicus]|uniref:ABC transporter substrate-binding protein n=1 Tax=Rubrobacter naiadicus TaxID=1392641 RepID=UPI00235F77AD|nr:extracellular solute-binding protein [Rubrobacter naiadicus]